MHISIHTHKVMTSEVVETSFFWLNFCLRTENRKAYFWSYDIPIRGLHGPKIPGPTKLRPIPARRD